MKKEQRAMHLVAMEEKVAFYLFLMNSTKKEKI